jgi:acyl-Coa thioesterase superfamily protein/acyl-CoA thioesterase superfamily protein
MADAFYEPEGDGFVATELTRGPWSKDAEHGGPPSALLARSVERALPDGFRLARLTVDLLRPVPIGRVVPRATVQAGRRTARAQVVLEADGREVVVGTALAQRVDDLALPAAAQSQAPEPLGFPTEVQAPVFFQLPWDEGYHTATEWRLVDGAWTELGGARIWMRQRVPLVVGEEPSPAQRTLVVADAGNGVSAAVDFADHTFLNADLTVHLHRDPVGEWIGMDARTVPQPTGAGLATTVLHDRSGPVGTGNQSLLIARW